MVTLCISEAVFHSYHPSTLQALCAQQLPQIGAGEENKNLKDEPEFKEMVASLKDFEESVDGLLTTKEETTESLNILTEAVEERIKVKVSGVALLMAGLSFLTFGPALLLHVAEALDLNTPAALLVSIVGALGLYEAGLLLFYIAKVIGFPGEMLLAVFAVGDHFAGSFGESVVEALVFAIAVSLAGVITSGAFALPVAGAPIVFGFGALCAALVVLFLTGLPSRSEAGAFGACAAGALGVAAVDLATDAFIVGALGVFACAVLVYILQAAIWQSAEHHLASTFGTFLAYAAASFMTVGLALSVVTAHSFVWLYVGEQAGVFAFSSVGAILVGAAGRFGYSVAEAPVLYTTGALVVSVLGLSTIGALVVFTVVALLMGTLGLFISGTHNSTVRRVIVACTVSIVVIGAYGQLAAEALNGFEAQATFVYRSGPPILSAVGAALSVGGIVVTVCMFCTNDKPSLHFQLNAFQWANNFAQEQLNKIETLHEHLTQLMEYLVKKYPFMSNEQIWTQINKEKNASHASGSQPDHVRKVGADSKQKAGSSSFKTEAGSQHLGKGHILTYEGFTKTRAALNVLILPSEDTQQTLHCTAEEEFFVISTSKLCKAAKLLKQLVRDAEQRWEKLTKLMNAKTQLKKLSLQSKWGLCPAVTHKGNNKHLITVTLGEARILQAPGSDVSLSIPPNSPGIYCLAIYTDMTRFLPFIPNEECIIAPVVEVVHVKLQSDTSDCAPQRVCKLTIPHCRVGKVSGDTLQVRRFALELCALEHTAQNRPPIPGPDQASSGMMSPTESTSLVGESITFELSSFSHGTCFPGTFEVDNDVIKLYTTDFSVFTCTSGEHECDAEILISIFGKLKSYPEEGSTTVDVKAFFLSELYKIKDVMLVSYLRVSAKCSADVTHTRRT